MGNLCSFSHKNSSLSPASTGSDSVPSSKEISSTTTTGRFSTFSSSTFGQSTSSGVSIDDSFPNGKILESPNLRVFTFAELKSATKNFKPETLLRGGFRRIYKGWVDEKTLTPAKSGLGMVIAVQKLRHDESMNWHGYEEWQSEVNLMGRLSHPNLVKVLGYCREDKELLVVYEFMSRGSLGNHLFSRGAAFDPLSWNLRIKIAIGAARGLSFLHSSDKQIIFRGFNTSNILLDSNYNAKLSEYGLARKGPIGSESHVTTRICGTIGYMDPEYLATGHLYVKSDVYGFGVVLLEMLSGQRALDPNRPDEQLSLVNLVKPHLADRRKLSRMMDPRLEGHYPSKGALQAAQLAYKCLSNEPRSRPSMKEVVETLEEIEASKGRSRELKEAFPKRRPRHLGQAPSNTRSHDSFL